jgi:CTP:molybdopterin cytidylyltransferase MocA
MPPTDQIAAIVLAAGRSQRMGAFKPLLPFGPTTVIEACIEHLRRAGIEAVIVVIGADARAIEITQHLKNTGVDFAVNPDPDSQMSSSITCGLRKLPESSKAVVITPADHPAVPAEVTMTLMDEWTKGARLVMPTNKGRGGHPVLIDLFFHEELQNLDERRGLRGFLDTHQDELVRIAVDSDYIARDMDTWDDYVALHQNVFGFPPPEAIV